MEIYNILADLHWATQAALFLVPYLALCLLTSRINSARLALAIEKVNGFFVYEGETGLEKWRVLSEGEKGDCEDYSLSVIHAYSGKLFLWYVCNPFAFRMWYVTAPNGISHLVTVCKSGAFDNHRKQLTAVSDYKARGYRFRFPWPFPLILMKLIIGKF